MSALTAPTLLESIASAANNPAVDAAKMHALLDVKIRIDQIAAENQFWDAMRACQNEMEPIRKDAQNQENKAKYAKVSTIQKRIQPIYHKHQFNLSFTAANQSDPNVVPLRCVVSHSCGHRQMYELSAAIDNKGAKGGGTKTEVQGTMSTSSYLRRKLYELIFDLVLIEDDDDGNLGRKTAKITSEQADTIRTMVNDLGAGMNRELFFKFCSDEAAPITRIEDIPAFKFEKVVQMLEAKARQTK
jgi:hypothetical protein